MDKKLIKKLHAGLRGIHSKYRCINYGGCGDFAVALHKALTKHGETAEIVVCTNNPRGAKRAIAESKKNNSRVNLEDLNENYSTYLAHIMVKCGDVVLDSTGVHGSTQDAGWCEDTVMDFSVDDIEAMLWDDGWNSAYDKEQTPGIERDINELVGTSIL